MKKQALEPIPLLHDRFFILCCTSGLLFLGLVVRLYDLQVIHHEEYSSHMTIKHNEA
ncbi:hypothetical protein [Sporanaerobium hydrogeniformans]|uniref:hypothetical protein n=1 Tax=Sporanaerobium hydrogeniformans TaxID=3072179 RepID=UPI0015D476B4|nr:hypothetical protein [Sporanaerobium hydrogeniformans]